MAIALVAVPAKGGPWLRGEGEGFFSLAALTNPELQLSYGLYLEYGISQEVTLGATAFKDADGSEQLVFMRRALEIPNQTLLFAYDLGIGINAGDPFLRLGLNTGRGFEWRDRNGWMSLDTAFDIGPVYRIKSDATLGLSFTDQSKGIAQIYLSHTAEETEITFAPSATWSPRNSKSTIQVGLEAKKGDVQAKVSLWYNF